jgi:hypothetical protein
VGGFEGGPDRVPVASKVSVALHMGQTRGPAFLAFKWVANLAYLPVSSILSPLPKNLRGILTDFPLGMNDRYGGGRDDAQYPEGGGCGHRVAVGEGVVVRRRAKPGLGVVLSYSPMAHLSDRSPKPTGRHVRPP